MHNGLEHRVHYELPLNHPEFEKIRAHCIHVGHEQVSDYRHSEDGLLIQVKCYEGEEIPEMSGLSLVDENPFVPSSDVNKPLFLIALEKL